MNVPGKMAWDELAFLSELAAHVPSGGKIVEIGPLFGRSTNAIASAAPSAQITSIDTFDNADWIKAYQSKLRDVPDFGIDAFRHYTKKFKNVSAIQGYSPTVVQNWAEPIDMYFEDATHGNPNLKQNMDFWISHLRPGGVVCGHDYTLRFPDVKREADKWAKQWGVRADVVGSLWALRKPSNASSKSTPISSDLGELYDGPRLLVRVKNRISGVSEARSGYWAGAHLAMDPIQWISIDIEEPVDGLRIEYQVWDGFRGRSGWKSCGEKAFLGDVHDPLPIWGFQARLKGVRARQFVVFYRLGYRQIGNGGYKVSEVTQWFSKGQLVTAKNPGADASSFSMGIASRMPPHSQVGFSLPVSRRLWRAVKGIGALMR